MVQKVFEQINEQIDKVLTNNPLKDFEKNIKAIIVSIFNRLDLVTREEFDVQQRVLFATRKKLEELEQQLSKLEHQSKHSH